MINQPPAVSIILPTYNRGGFLPDAMRSICDQTWKDWELIIVDDGSTDDTGKQIHDLKDRISQNVRYIYQENQGAYGARNTGLEEAKGRYVAFYDSDDTWLNHHLKNCVQAMEANHDVDWVYGSCSIHEWQTGKLLSENTFLTNGSQRPFRQLRFELRGDLHVITDPKAASCQLQHGLYSGLQNSVIRRQVFQNYRFETALRNEAEDQIIVVRALLAGHRLAYFDRIHVEYHVHDANSSAVGTGGGMEKKIRVVKAMIAGFDQLLETPGLPKSVRKSIKKRLGRDYFWLLGYSLLWKMGRFSEAKIMYRKGIQSWPWDWRCWKTLLSAELKTRQTWLPRNSGQSGSRQCGQKLGKD